MLNKNIIMGRLTRDPVVKEKDGEVYAKYCLACERDYKTEIGNTPVDYIDCIVFGKKALWTGNNLKQGNKIVVTGRLASSIYSDDSGKNVKSITVIVEDQYFAGYNGEYAKEK